LEKHKEDNPLLSLLQQMDSILQNQYDLLQSNVDEQTFEQVVNLSREWMSISDVFTEISRDPSVADSVSNEEAIKALIETMLNKVRDIEHLLLSVQDSMVSSMSSIKKQQTIIRSYGGLGYKDSIPLYLDEKK
jgi:hypothetical protein